MPKLVGNAEVRNPRGPVCFEVLDLKKCYELKTTFRTWVVWVLGGYFIRGISPMYQLISFLIKGG